MIICKNKYGKYSLPKTSLHRPVCQKIRSGEVHEPETIEFILEYAGNGTVIHAGTYFGDFLPALGKHCRWVIAFEPNHENFKCAMETIALNNLNNVHLFNHALSDGKERYMLRTIDENFNSLGGMSFLDTFGEQFVTIVPLDKLIINKNGISIIHLDVEGHEQQALDGMKQIIEINRPIIITESLVFLYHYNYSTILNRLDERNYVYIHEDDERQVEL